MDYWSTVLFRSKRQNITAFHFQNEAYGEIQEISYHIEPFQINRSLSMFILCGGCVQPILWNQIGTSTEAENRQTLWPFIYNCLKKSLLTPENKQNMYPRTCTARNSFTSMAATTKTAQQSQSASVTNHSEQTDPASQMVPYSLHSALLFTRTS